MEKLVWKSEYEIGDFEIDAEHQIFLKIINKMISAFEDENEKEYKVLLLTELYKYADFHFLSEENKMMLHNYPGFEEHKLAHKALLSSLSNQIGYFNLKYIEKTKLLNFLLQWLFEHTTKMDIQFGKFLNENAL